MAFGHQTTRHQTGPSEVGGRDEMGPTPLTLIVPTTYTWCVTCDHHLIKVAKMQNAGIETLWCGGHSSAVHGSQLTPSCHSHSILQLLQGSTMSWPPMPSQAVLHPSPTTTHLPTTTHYTMTLDNGKLLLYQLSSISHLSLSAVTLAGEGRHRPVNMQCSVCVHQKSVFPFLPTHEP